LKVERDATLTCSSCGIEGAHELLYLSRHLCASRCAICGYTQVYSDHIYTAYARDLADRTSRLPAKVAGEMFHPMEVAKWPFKALGKPLGLFREVTQVTDFEHSRRSTAPPRQAR